MLVDFLKEKGQTEKIYYIPCIDIIRQIPEGDFFIFYTSLILFNVEASRFVFEQMGENWTHFPRDEIYSAMEPGPCLSLSFIGC